MQLDFLRGIAILLVLIHHSVVRDGGAGWLGPILKPVITFGWGGVTLFFVLSGFLVGGLLFSEIRQTGDANVGRFLIRRSFKIWPSYIVYLFYYFLKLLHRKESLREAFSKMWPNLLHIQNYIETPPGQTWSLAVEEHFYLAFAIFVIFLGRGTQPVERRLRVIPWTTLILLIGCLFLRSLNWSRPFNVYTHLWPTQFCIDSLFLGVFLAYIYYFKPNLFDKWCSHRRLFILFGLAAEFPMFIVPREAPPVFTMGVTFMALGFASLIVAVAPSPLRNAVPARFWSNPLIAAVAWIGLYSYSIYLWNGDLVNAPVVVLLAFIWRHGPPAWQCVVYLTLYLGGSIIVGFILAKIIEFPALRLRDRILPAHSRATTAADRNSKIAQSSGATEATTG